MNVDGAPQPEVGLIARFDPATGAWNDPIGRDWRNAVRLSLPDTDVFAIADLPDNAAAAALALHVSASGGATVRTTVLLTPEEIDAATKKTVQYTAPGA